MNTETFKNIPKAYYIVAGMALIVIGILIFGGGKNALSSLDKTTVEFKLKSSEEIVNEDKQVDNVLITSKDFKAKISVDPVNVINYDSFISALKEPNAEIKISIQNSDKKLLQDDEIIETENIWVNGVDYSAQEKK